MRLHRHGFGCGRSFAGVFWVSLYLIVIEFDWRYFAVALGPEWALWFQVGRDPQRPRDRRWWPRLTWVPR